MRTLLVSFCLLLLVAVPFAASQEPKAATSGSKAASPVVATEADNNGRLTVARGTLLLVRLKANPTTGYSWQLGSDPKPLALQSSEFERSKQDQPLAGSPEIQVMRFETSAVGTASLVLEYRRPWEKNAAPAKTFKLQVTVE